MAGSLWPHLTNDNTSQDQQYIGILNQNDFIVGANNPPGMVAWVDNTIWFKTNGEMIKNGDNINQSNINIFYILDSENGNYRTFNGKDTGREDLMSLDSSLFSVCVIVTDPEDNKEPHILSCHWRSQTGHY